MIQIKHTLETSVPRLPCLFLQPLHGRQVLNLRCLTKCCLMKYFLRPSVGFAAHPLILVFPAFGAAVENLLMKRNCCSKRNSKGCAWKIPPKDLPLPEER